MSRVSKLFSAAVAVVLLTAPIRAAASVVSDELLSAAVGMRQDFGLRADVAYVLTLMTSASDVGTETWGFPLTAEEMQTLDLTSRADFQVNSHEVLEYARSVPEFGGAYFDQLQGGQLVLQFKDVTDAIKARVSQLAATDGPQTQIETVRYSFGELTKAMHGTQAALQAVAPSMELQSVGIREPENGLVADVVGSAVPASQLEVMVAAQLGVPIIITLASGPLVPGSCPARDQLCQPEEAGVWAGTTADGCTMGFHITNGASTQFVSAGHCAGTYWYQPYPYVFYLGYPQSNLYPSNSVDMQRVLLGAAAPSKYIFGEGSNVVYGSSNPSTGELVYGSLGHANAVRSGTVYIAWGTYSVNGYSFDGTDVRNLVTQGGDSGSPLYYRYPCCGRLYALATYSAGNSTDRWWARLTDAFQRWPGWYVYH